MIPKIIHYCWFGGKEKSRLAKKCIESWKRFCPDYEIREWNEENFDVNSYKFTEQAYEAGKYAFVSDVARLYAVYTCGGFYFDTDVELIRCPDQLRNEPAFMGMEKSLYVATGLGFGAQAKNEIIGGNLREYEKMSFINDDGSYNFAGCPRVTTRFLESYGLVRENVYQRLPELTVFPSEYFDPFDSTTGIMKKTKNTYSVHWYNQSFLSVGTRIRSRFARPFHRLFGKRKGGDA
ncbi:MAG TPA: glycosyltransferase [Bacillota bacterium]|nr:glycosyltransferase [Bacillota bacterium]